MSRVSRGEGTGSRRFPCARGAGPAPRYRGASARRPHLPRPGRDDRGAVVPAPASYARCPRLVRTTAQKSPKPKGLRGSGGSDRRRSGDLSIFSRTLYQLSYRARTVTVTVWSATPTGLEPATSAVTGRRANQLRHEASLGTKPDSWTSRLPLARVRTPNGIRTRATAVKGRGPGPLDDGGPLPLASSRLEPDRTVWGAPAPTQILRP